MGFFKGFLIAAVGFYGGVYACQNYDMPKIDDPQQILQKVKDYLKQFEKPK